MPATPTAFQRFLLAFAAWFRVLFDREFAEKVWSIRSGGQLPAAPPAPAALPGVAAPPPKPDTAPRAIQLLAILQRDGRLVDFLQEDLSSAADADIGAAVRATLYEGGRKALGSLVQLGPVIDQPEGNAVTIPVGFNPARIRVTGNVVGSPPFKGTLKHRGWQVVQLTLPELPSDFDDKVIAPAEVELS